MHITLGVGVPLGVMVAGREGVTLYEVRLGDPTAWFVHPAPYDALDVDHGAHPQPVAPLDLPAWMGGKRSIYEDAPLLAEP
jgi:hypothetical protein